ncbi:unnamed protein product [Chrysoparadoxa australica]
MLKTIVCLLALQCLAPAKAFTIPQTTLLHPKTARSATGLVMKSPLEEWGGKIAAASALAIIALSSPGEALAARSGGRVGGGSFQSAPRMAPRAAPRAPVRSGGGGGYARQRSVVPVPVPVPSYGYGMSPFSPFGSPFGYGGGISIYPSYGFNPLPLFLLGGAVVVLSNLGSKGSFDSIDDELAPSSLGSGVSVLKLQVALNCPDRSRNSILGQLAQLSDNADTSTNAGLANVVSDISLALLKKSSDWVSAASEWEHFGRDMSQAESALNRQAIKERSKIERETSVKFKGEATGAMARNAAGVSPSDIGRPTQAVVTLIVAIRGDSLRNFDLDKSLTSERVLKSVLQQLASDALSDAASNVLGCELLWTPEEPWDALERNEVIADFPELIDL